MGCRQLRVAGSPTVSGGLLTATIDGAGVPLILTAEFLSIGAVRVRLTEKDMPPRWQVGANALL